MSRDNATWLAHLAGDGQVQREALSDLREALLRGLRRALSHPAHADDGLLEDVVQEALIRILEHLGQFAGRSRFLTWATAIAIRVAISELRRRRWKDVSLDAVLADADFTLDRAIDEEPPLDAQWEQQAILDKMHDLIQNDLTERQRTALLAELKGMPQQEIARRLGSQRNAVYKLTHDARRRLKRGLEAAGYAADDIFSAFVN